MIYLDLHRRMLPGTESIERLHRWPGLRRKLLDAVYIYSRKQDAFWREGEDGLIPAKRCGKFPHPSQPGAGVWTIDEALKLTRHCRPEHQIELHSMF